MAKSYFDKAPEKDQQNDVDRTIIASTLLAALLQKSDFVSSSTNIDRNLASVAIAYTDSLMNALSKDEN